MIVNHTDSGEIHSRYDMDLKLIEVYVPTTSGERKCLFLRPHQAENLADTLKRLVEAHRGDTQSHEEHKVSILWGGCPEPGQKAVTYKYDTKAELQAFLDGIECADGWMGYQIVEEGYVYDPDEE